MGSGPIFIGGLSFSGKTPLRLMLVAHPNIVITRRTRMWTRFYGRFGDLGRPENFERCLNAMLNFRHMHVLAPDPPRIRHEFWQGAPSYERLFALLHEHHAGRLGKARWGDQLGRVEQYADVILTAYPAAKMIHMVRDPRQRRDNIISSRRRRIKVGWETAEWRRSARLARRNQQRYPDRYKVIHYEQLYAHPEQTLRQVCAFLEEDYLPQMLAAGILKHEAGSQKANAENEALSDREITLIQMFSKREMLTLGYEPAPLSLSLKDRLLLLIEWPMSLAGACWQNALNA